MSPALPQVRVDCGPGQPREGRVHLSPGYLTFVGHSLDVDPLPQSWLQCLAHVTRIALRAKGAATADAREEREFNVRKLMEDSLLLN